MYAQASLSRNPQYHYIDYIYVFLTRLGLDEGSGDHFAEIAR
jgi:hypothetical protein